MNAPEAHIEIPAIVGTPTEIGFYFGRIRVGESIYALFQPPKAISAHMPAPWNENYELVEDAYSFCDGQANTEAMAKAGSKLAQWALDNGMHIPALDESDLQYRAFKPTIAENDCWMRSGINLSAETPLQPYTPGFPARTEIEPFRTGGAEAFLENLHWTSTQYRAHSDYAWVQDFGDGHQLNALKLNEFPVRAVRRLLIR
jgi:hypothetical protein